MKKIHFVIDGEPVPQQRPRFYQTNGVRRVVDPNKKDKDKFKSRIRLKMACGKNEKMTGPVKVDLKYIIERPKSHYRTGRYKHLVRPTAPEYNSSDVDNYAKFTLDCMNEICYRDDSQIVVLSVVKQYGAEGCTEVYVEPIQISWIDRIFIKMRRLTEK